MKLSDKRLTGKNVFGFVLDNYLYVVIAILAICVAIRYPLFLRNAPLDILKRTAAYVMMALGAGGIMLMGAGIDLSSGRIMGFLALIASSLLEMPGVSGRFPNIDTLPIPVVIFIVLMLGVLIGGINGAFVAMFKLPAFIVTLGTQLILYGGILCYLNFGTNQGMSISNMSYEYKDLVTGTPIKIGSWAIPNYVFMAIFVIIIVWIVWKYTPLGKNMRLIGTNREAAEAANVNIFWTTLTVFAMAGAFYGINGFIEAARIGGPGAGTGGGDEIDAVIACLLGGVSLKGGVGKVGGIVVGVVLLQLMSVCFQWLSVSTNYVYIIKGTLLVLAVVMDARKHWLRKE